MRLQPRVKEAPGSGRPGQFRTVSYGGKVRDPEDGDKARSLEGEDEVPLYSFEQDVLFDPEEVFEYVTPRTQVDRGAVWIDGENLPCIEILWGPKDISMLQARLPRRRQEDTDIKIRVVDGVQRRATMAAGGKGDSLRRPSLKSVFLAAAAATAMGKFHSEAAPSGAEEKSHEDIAMKAAEQGQRRISAAIRPVSAPTRGRAMPKPRSPRPEDHPPECIAQISQQRWLRASLDDKRQMVLKAAPVAGEVSGLIQQVQCRSPRIPAMPRPSPRRRGTWTRSELH